MKKLLILVLLLSAMTNAQELDFLYEAPVYDLDLGLYEILDVTYYDLNGILKGSSETKVDYLGNYETTYYNEYHYPVGKSETYIRGRIPTLNDMLYKPIKYYGKKDKN